MECSNQAERLATGVKAQVMQNNERQLRAIQPTTLAIPIAARSGVEAPPLPAVEERNRGKCRTAEVISPVKFRGLDKFREK
jgi:hypothetical protein